MLTIPMEKKIELRGKIYQLLSSLYNEPDETFSILVQSLQNIMFDYSDDFVGICGQMNQFLNDDATDVEMVFVDYSKLFVGPFQLLAPPYSSIYLEDKWEVMGKSTLQIEGYYKRVGLHLDSSIHIPADHIRVQFEFMNYLNNQWLESGELYYRELQKEFLYKILTHWIPKFNQAIQAGASTKFYKLLGEFTEKFILKEFDTI